MGVDVGVVDVGFDVDVDVDILCQWDFESW